MDKNPPANAGDTGLIPGPRRTQRRVASAHHKERNPGPAAKTHCSQRIFQKLQSSRKYFPAPLPTSLPLFLPACLPACLPSLLPSSRVGHFQNASHPSSFTLECQGPESGCGITSVSAKTRNSGPPVNSRRKGQLKVGIICLCWELLLLNIFKHLECLLCLHLKAELCLFQCGP